MTVSNDEKMEAPTKLNTRTLANSLEIKTKQMKVAQYPWRHRPCRHCGGGHFDSTCMRNNIPKMQRMEQTQKTLTHTFSIDLDGDIAMTEWTECLYCLSS
jgi:hypothetical protein